MPDANRIEVQSIVSAADGKPYVQLKWGDQVGQLTPDEARQHALALLDAANAAETDAGLLRFIRQQGGTERQAAALLAHFRTYRGDDADRKNWRDPKETHDATH